MNALRNEEFLSVMRRLGVVPTRYLLAVSVRAQTMRLFEKVLRQAQPRAGCNAFRLTPSSAYALRKTFRISTSAFGIGQKANTNRTPLGLHRIAVKAGGGHPVGTVFKSRRPVGFTWEGRPDAAIVHRILWLEGLEPGFNRGGDVDTFQRFIYIHGFGDESTLGRPASHGCIHLAGKDLVPLYDMIPAGTLVWIGIQ